MFEIAQAMVVFGMAVGMIAALGALSMPLDYRLSIASVAFVIAIEATIVCLIGIGILIGMGCG